MSFIFLILKLNETEGGKQSKEDREKNVQSYIAKMKIFVLFFTDFVVKNTEMKMRPILIFFLFLIVPAWVHIESYFEVSIPGLAQLIPLTNIPHVWALLFYAILFYLLGFRWGEILVVLSWWSKLLAKGFALFTAGVISWQSSRTMKNILGDLLYKLKKYSVSIVKILSGGLLIMIWAIPLLCILAFILLLPIYLPIALIFDCGVLEFTQLTGRFLIVFLASYFIFKILEILFSIHLIERIKNNRIAWLKQIKIDLHDIPEDDHQTIERAWKKFNLSELYLPEPYTALLAFTRYKIIPVFPYCGEDELAKERLDFLNYH